MATFALPPIVDNPGSWGPPPGADLEPGCLDFEVDHLEKYPLSKVGRICDFSQSGMRFAEQRAAKGAAKGKGKKGFEQRMIGKEEDGFELVDHKALPGKSFGKGRGGKSKGKGKGIAINYQEGILGQKQKPFYAANQNQQKGKGKKGKGRGFNRQREPSFKEWSVETKSDWVMKQEIMLNALTKLQCNARECVLEDVYWCGILHDYNREFDRLTVRTEKPMERFEDVNFYNVTTTDDPILKDEIQNDETITVIATEQILACLVAAARSVYSWDIVITKVGDRLIFDKRDGSHIDFLTVNETAMEAPNNDDKESINAPSKLGQEASCINQNFSQMVLDTSLATEMDHSNPFDEEGECRVASGAYRYRKITIPGNPKDEVEFNTRPVTMFVRTEVNCKISSSGPAGDNLVSLKALNEFDIKRQASWRTHLEGQRGAVLATELKNNAFKLARWTAQAMFAGCDIIKVGYVSRVRVGDPWSHSVLGVQSYHTDGFGEQIGMTRNNVFGILRSIIDLIMSYDDGKYVILKDPTKSVMRIYEVPWDSFGDEGEEEEDMMDVDVDVDEDGNKRPPRLEAPNLPRPGGV